MSAPTVRDRLIDGERARAGDHQCQVRGKEDQNELVTIGQEEAVRQMDDEQRPEHIDGEAERNESRQYTKDESDSTGELEHGNQRRNDGWQRNSHLGEPLRDARDSELEKLLCAVREHDYAGDDPNDRDSNAQLPR